MFNNILLAVDGSDHSLNAARTASEEQVFLQQLGEFLKEETGYQWIQGTRPTTLSFALTDSPAGLAAWIVEKFRAWTDNTGEPDSAVSLDEMLTTSRLYWVAETINSSVRLYYETMHNPALRGGVEGHLDQVFKVPVPTGAAVFPAEIYRPPRAWAERTYNITRWTEMPAGGHFAAMEEPVALVEDVRAFFRPLRP